MAGVSVPSGGGGGRKSVDSNVNMVPMIDLLISVIAFLLMTAVWVQTGTLEARQPRTRGEGTPPPVTDPLRIAITRDGFNVGQSAADQLHIATGPNALDGLREALRRRHTSDPQGREVVIQPDSAVEYSSVVDVMDAVYEVWGQGRPAGARAGDRVNIQLM